MNLEQEFKQMLLELQSVGDVYEYPCTAWGVLQEYKDKIQSHIEALKKDAERYRWLRLNMVNDGVEESIDIFDSNIDTAMQSEKGDNDD